MKNFKIDGLNGRVSIRAKELIKALDLKLSFSFFVSGKNCPRCLYVEKEIKNRNILIFEIPYDEFFKIRDKGMTFVFSFPTGIIVEDGKIKESFLMGEDSAETFVDHLTKDMDKEETNIPNPFYPVYDKDGKIRRYKVGEGSLEKLG